MTIVGGEERVMRAREVLAAAFAKLPHGRARAESFRTPAFTTDDDQVILGAMLVFADEGSGIGEREGSFVEQFRKAVGEDAWLSIPPYLQNWITAKALATHRAALSQSS